MKTAVLAKYSSPSFPCRVLEYLINNTNPTICPTNRSRLPYFIIMALELLRADLTGLIFGIDAVDRFTDSCPWFCLWRTAVGSSGSGPLIIFVLMSCFMCMYDVVGVPEQISNKST
mmetsp:Transcript_25138/g.41441  ORF Transcript_25138/g.41441 Transcript_25138/m.41441 type:complete len:116 (-) Transcript_25138:170-517(-)